MDSATDKRTGEILYARPRGPLEAEGEDGLSKECCSTTCLVQPSATLWMAGVLERVAMEITGHKTRAVFERYNIVSPNDLMDAGKRLAEFHSGKFGDNSGTVCTTITMQQTVSAVN